MASFEAQITNVSHRFLHVNGIRMHIAEQGEGPLVVPAHGFPELVHLAARLARARRGWLPRGRAGYARLWPNGRSARN
jgi:hypothetical protein